MVMYIEMLRQRVLWCLCYESAATIDDISWL